MDFEHFSIYTTGMPVIAWVMKVTYRGIISDYCTNKGGITLRRPLAYAKVRLFSYKERRILW